MLSRACIISGLAAILFLLLILGCGKSKEGERATPTPSPNTTIGPSPTLIAENSVYRYAKEVGISDEIAKTLYQYLGRDGELGTTEKDFIDVLAKIPLDIQNVMTASLVSRDGRISDKEIEFIRRVEGESFLERDAKYTAINIAFKDAEAQRELQGRQCSIQGVIEAGYEDGTVKFHGPTVVIVLEDSPQASDALYVYVNAEEHKVVTVQHVPHVPRGSSPPAGSSE